MTIGIIGAMEPEVKTLISKLQESKTTVLGPHTFYSGTLCGHEVTVVQCGIGKVSAAAVTALMIECLKAECIINTGSAGGIGRGLKVGDTVFSTKAAYHDADLTIFGYAKGQMAGHELYFNADPQLMAKAEIAAANVPELKEHGIRKGAVLSGDQFISDPKLSADLLKAFPEALVTEMEGAAIAQVASDFKVPFIIIRAVSDCADEGNPMTYEQFLPLASENSAKLVMSLVKLL